MVSSYSAPSAASEILVQPSLRRPKEFDLVGKRPCHGIAFRPGIPKQPQGIRSCAIELHPLTRTSPYEPDTARLPGLSGNQLSDFLKRRGGWPIGASEPSSIKRSSQCVKRLLGSIALAWLSQRDGDQSSLFCWARHTLVTYQRHTEISQSAAAAPIPAIDRPAIRHRRIGVRTFVSPRNSAGVSLKAAVC
jgi:hypothetical protein